MSHSNANAPTAFAYCDFLDFVITDSIKPGLRKRLEQIQACHRRATKASARPRNIRRASSHLQRAVRLFMRYRGHIELLPAEAFARPPVPFTEPSYD